MKKLKTAFTLAEVLITLVIIGVIGALTVPALIQNTQKQEYVSALKKAYSTLSQVTQQIIAEEGSPKGEDSWMSDVDALYEMYKKHLNVIKDCGTERNCFGGINYKPLNLDPNYGGTFENRSTARNLILADGVNATFYFSSKDCNARDWGTENTCAIIDVDINGKKRPNIIGRDFFRFDLKENGLVPAGCDVIGNGHLESGCDTAAFGFGCACRVLHEGAFNY